MLKQKETIKWPEHTNWWDRNEFKINVILWGSFLILLFVAKFIFFDREITLMSSAIWLFLFISDLFLLSFTDSPVR